VERRQHTGRARHRYPSTCSHPYSFVPRSLSGVWLPPSQESRLRQRQAGRNGCGRACKRRNTEQKHDNTRSGVQKSGTHRTHALECRCAFLPPGAPTTAPFAHSAFQRTGQSDAQQQPGPMGTGSSRYGGDEADIKVSTAYWHAAPHGFFLPWSERGSWICKLIGACACFSCLFRAYRVLLFVSIRSMLPTRRCYMIPTALAGRRCG